jgi:hypothetical protein
MKRLLTMVAVAVALSIGLSGLALAKDKKKKGSDETVFNFEEDEVTVSFLKPEMGFVGVIEQEKIASLIKIRQDFVDEIVRSAEDL